MPEGPAYVVLGRGRWAGRIQSILDRQRRKTTAFGETRRQAAESDASYKLRLSAAMVASTARIAWLCLPPGPHIPLIVEAVISAGLHVVVEKPWFSSVADTEPLIALARSSSRLVAIHYEYCFLDEVQSWRRQFDGGNGLRFGGRFTHSRPDHLGISALDNLGSHLVAIQTYAVPQSELKQLSCGYELPDERCVWLENEGRRIAFIDLLASKEPIIERFIASFESATGGADFALDLEFALRIASAAEALKLRRDLSS